MPKAVIDITESKRFELKSCPEGYVVLRRLSYGQWLKRQQDAMTMAVAQDGANAKGMKADITMMTVKVTAFDFASCIVEHNLTGADDQPLDFRSPIVLDILDPRVGQEIGDLIDSMNNFEDQGNS